jgi:hypothetical protein
MGYQIRYRCPGCDAASKSCGLLKISEVRAMGIFKAGRKI